MTKLLFNTSFELGLRGLFLLTACSPRKCSLGRLIYLDYLTIYTSEIDSVNSSLHPVYPLKSVELFGKREVLKKGLLLMASKGLINLDCEEDGFKYSATINTSWFIESLTVEYSSKLLEKAMQVEGLFGRYTDDELERLVWEDIKPFKTLEFFSMFE